MCIPFFRVGKYSFVFLFSVWCLVFYPGILYSEGAPNGIGIYFDNQGDINCLPNIVEYPYFCTAYLLLINCDYVSGVAGWEAKIYSDETIMLTTSIMGESINMGSYPNIQVGLTVPLQYSDSIVLASLSILAFGPGALYLSGIDVSSIIGAESPVFVPGAHDGVLVCTEYLYGGAGLASASIGDVACPEENIFGEAVPDNYSVLSDPSAPESGGVVIVKIPAGLVSFEQGEYFSSLSDAFVGSEELSGILIEHGVSHVGMLMPQHYGADLTRVNRVGDTVELTDLSSYYILWTADKTSEDELVGALLSSPLINECCLASNAIDDTAPNDEYYESRQWSLNNTGQLAGSVIGDPGVDIDVEGAWDTETGDSGITVGIVETGVDALHNDLIGRFDNTVPIVSEHGTRVSGVVGAIADNYFGIAGVDWNARMILCDRSGSGHDKAINAVYYGIDNGASVLNHSYHLISGTSILSEYGPFRNAMIDAHLMNIVSVAASGNDAESGNEVGIPAKYGHVLTVGGVDNRGERYETSTYGAFLDVMAPGHNVYVLQPGDDFIEITGTSYAAPHVAGIASLMLAHSPELHNDDVYNIIRYTSRDIVETGVGYDEETGYGLVSAKNAIEALEYPYLLTSGYLDNCQYISDWGEWRPAQQYLYPSATSSVIVKLQRYSWYNIHYSNYYTGTPKLWIRTAATVGYPEAFRYVKREYGADIVDHGDGTFDVHAYKIYMIDYAGREVGVFPSGELHVALAAWGLATDPDVGVEALPDAALLRVDSCPNPFNATTAIRAYIVSGGNYTISIYDLRGRLTQRWLGVAAPAEQVVVVWDGLDSDGRESPSGTYNICVSNGGESDACRVTLVK